MYRKVPFIICFLIVFRINISKAQDIFVKGIVTNANLEPIALVNVSVIDFAYLNTSTSISGEYKVNIKEGSYVFVFTFDGYKTLKMPITVRATDIIQNIILEDNAIELESAKVVNKSKDKSVEIIRKVIANKQLYGNPDAYTVKAYIKATEEEITPKKKKDTTVTVPQMNIAEIFMTLNSAPPAKIKEERTGVNIRGEKDGLFYLTHTDGDFNWYRNLIQIPALSESPILSPISNSGIVAYKYKMLKAYYEGDKKYYRIKVSPGILGNALVTGELTIMDSSFCIVSLKLSMPKYHMLEYDAFEVSQKYQFIDSHYCLAQQEFNYSAKFGKTKNTGRTVVYYSDYLFKQEFKKRFFNNELSSTSVEAYEKDTNFWSFIRKEPFTISELAFIRKSDSTKALQSQKYWQDSVDRNFNKITLKKIFLMGQGNYKRSNERYWTFKPLIFSYLPIYIAGPRVQYWVGYERIFKNKKTIELMPTANFGVLNNDLKGSLNFGRLYNPFNIGRINISVGSDFGIINPFDAWIAIFKRSNFYVEDFGSIFHRVELINGLYLGNGLKYSNRRSISDYKFDSRGDLFYGGPNKAIDFDYYKALYGTISISYVPFQKYIREPYQKQVLGSKWPEITAIYKKGLNILGSTINFDYLEFKAEQELKVGLAGVSRYRIISGEFLTSQDLRLIDYEFQRRAGPIFFTNPMYSFQGIDTTFSTIKRFYEAHYFHRFNGAILNKIPLIKQLKLIECVGGGLLYTRERNLKYAEAFIGFEKVIRLWKERFKIGVFYNAAVSNLYTYLPQLKFTIETFDNKTNKWSY
ncbi:MAG: carboxypeptidase-like regulatory domain-containing protein [Bacteroidetes bacterium]|nr:carboxypeptidase-like regulatory domain-containing protein [Bacteroidota bacterium]